MPSSRELPRPPCWKDSKIRSRSASGTPIPVSVTVIWMLGVRTRPRGPRTEPPSPVNLTALVIRLSSDLLEPELVGVHLAHAVADLDSQVDAVRARPARAASTRRRSSSARRSNDGVLQLHPAGLDLGQVEDLVEQLEQVLAGAVDVAEVLLLALVDVAEHPLEQHLGEPEDGVERRPQLVRHAREELRLVPAGQLRARRSAPASSRKSRAFSRASADWLANVSSRSRVSSVKSPVRLRRTMSDPTIWSSRSIGTATRERQPSSCRICRCGSSSDRVEVGDRDRAALTRGAPDQGLVEVDPDRTAAARPPPARCGRRCGP